MAKIMVIDDDKELAANTATLLEAKGGHEVVVRNTTDGAIEALVDEAPDLLVLDVMFPKRPSAGFDLARKIRQSGKLLNLPVILLTGINQHFPMDFSAENINKDWIPVQDFVDKGTESDVLLARINKLLGEK